VIDSVKARRAGAIQRWLDEYDPQIREHVVEAAEPVDARDVSRALAWVREYVGAAGFDATVSRLAQELGLPLDSKSVWPNHLRKVLGA
jgi:hypothetical protein